MSICLFSITLLQFSCKDKRVDKNHNQVDGHLHYKDGDVDHSLIDTAITQLEFASKVDDLSRGLFSVQNNMLYFEDFDGFNSFMESFITKSDEVILEFVASLSNFSSLRTSYETLMNDENIDDLEVEESRIADPFFEAVLNEELSIRIQDTVYKFDEGCNNLSFYHIDEFLEIADTSFRNVDLSAARSSCCSSNGKCFNHVVNTRLPGWGNNNHKEWGKKWVDYWGIYSSIGHKAVHYKKNSNGNWKRHSRPGIATTIDEYYEVVYWPKKGGSSANPMIYSPIGNSITYADRNSWNCVNIISFSSFLICSNCKKVLDVRWCVSEFGRTHNWSYGVGESLFGYNWLYNDCHVDAW